MGKVIEDLLGIRKKESGKEDFRNGARYHEELE